MNENQSIIETKQLALRKWTNAEVAFNYSFKNLCFREIIALTALDDIASQKVLEKIGFTKRGIETFGGEENLVYMKCA